MHPASSPPPVARLRALVAGIELPPGALAALAVLASFACAGLVVVWWTARPVPTDAPAPPVVRTAPATVAPAPGQGRAPPAGTVVVHVSGAVASEGVLELPGGARVVDAVDAAGGPRRGARTDGLNLARVVRDGEQIHVPTRREVSAAAVAGPRHGQGSAAAGGAGSGPARGAIAAAGPGAAGTGARINPLNLNAASPAELEQLPGVGPVLAGRISAHRDSVGGFTAVEQLLEVDGIGEKTFAALRELVSV